MKLFENIRINEQAIKLINYKQLSYGPIYFLNVVELETVETYIETHLKIGFIQHYKSSVGAIILYDKKLN